MLDHATANRDEVTSVVGADAYELFTDGPGGLADGVKAHEDGVLSYAIITAHKP